MRRVLIVDGHNIFIRCLIAVPLLDSNGEPVGGTVGALRSLAGVIRDQRPTDVVFVWDGEGGSTRRRGLFAEYKAGRKVHLNRAYDFGESNDDHIRNFHRQRDLLVECLRLLGVPQVCVPELEGDDVIAFLSVNVYSDEEKVILSSDRDMLQLIGPLCSVYSPSKKVLYTQGSVLASDGVRPENMVYLRALVGDSSDNIDGIRGIGPKKAVAMYPELRDQTLDLQSFLKAIGDRADAGRLQRLAADSVELVTRNVQLMQLTSPTVSTQAARAIRAGLAAREPRASDMRIMLVREGIQFDDARVVSAFKELAARRPRLKPETEQEE